MELGWVIALCAAAFSLPIVIALAVVHLDALDEVVFWLLTPVFAVADFAAGIIFARRDAERERLADARRQEYREMLGLLPDERMNEATVLVGRGSVAFFLHDSVAERVASDSDARKRAEAAGLTLRVKNLQRAPWPSRLGPLWMYSGAPGESLVVLSQVEQLTAVEVSA